MIGNVDALTALGGETTEEYTMYVPLKFWFNRNNGLALPLIALQYHDVRVTIKLREACDLINFKGTTSVNSVGVTNSAMKDAYLLIDYVYLDSEERKRFAQAAHEYLIEQVQFTGDETLDSENHKYRLNFNHPSKYLVWNTCLDRYQDSRAWVEWAIDGDWEAARERFAKKLWLATRTNLEKTGSAYTLSMGDSTMEIGDVPAELSGMGTVLSALVGKVEAQVLFANDNVSAGNTTGANADLGNVVILSNKLTVEDMNLTVAELQALLPSTATTNSAFVGANGVYVRDYFNYSTSPNCTGNPIKTAKLQLNGHDRFSTRDGNYFNYVQPYQHFAVTPCDGINVYSFALKPIDHQPSGTCNFSRIDNTTLNLTTSATNSNSGVCKVYCVNYNVFRVMSGMGGLAYSN
jgi:hypothetical protein